MSFEPGTILDDRYRVEVVLHAGAHFVVAAVSHTKIERPQVAIKVMQPGAAADAEAVMRFRQEARITAQLKGEHVVRVLDFGKTEANLPFMMMELLAGTDLASRTSGPMPAAIAVDLMLQACDGLAEAHAQGVVHRDLEPSNLFVGRREDGTMHLTIVDFGLAYSRRAGSSASPSWVGTPPYASPEQLASSSSADARSDIWSLGVVLCELVSGQLPFTAPSFAELVALLHEGAPPSLPPMTAGLASVITACLQADPGARPHDVAELASRLVPFASDAGMAASVVERCKTSLASAR